MNLQYELHEFYLVLQVGEVFRRSQCNGAHAAADPNTAYSRVQNRI